MSDTIKEETFKLEIDGKAVTVTVKPFELIKKKREPLSDDELKSLYDEHVQHPDDHWKGRAIAHVAPEIADDVTEAMNYYGSIVDSRRELKSGLIKLYSRGYWDHGF